MLLHPGTGDAGRRCHATVMTRAEPQRRAALRAAAALACVAFAFLPRGDASPLADARPLTCSPAAWRQSQAWRDEIVRQAPREAPDTLAWVGSFWNRALTAPEDRPAVSLAEQRIHAQLRYLTLRALGMPASQLRLIYGVVHAPAGSAPRAAMALAYAPDATRPMLVLPAHRDAVVSAADLPEWTPVMHSEGGALADAAPPNPDGLPAALCALIEERSRAAVPHTP